MQIQFQQFLEAFSTGINRVYEDSLKQHPKTYTAILREEQTRHWFDTEWLTSGLGSMPRKDIGAAITTGTILKAPTKQHALDTFGLAVVIEYEAFKYDLYGIFDGMPEELAKSAVERMNVLGYSIYNNSFSAPNASYQTFQSENLISTAHTRLDGGTWTNQLSTNAAISYLALQDMDINLGKLVNERGRFVILDMSTVITSRENQWIAKEIVMSQYRPDNTAQNVNLMKGKLDVHASPYLTTPQYWWVLANKKDFRCFMRVGEQPNLKRDQDIRHQAFLVMSYFAGNVASYDSRGLVGSTGGA